MTGCGMAARVPSYHPSRPTAVAVASKVSLISSAVGRCESAVCRASWGRSRKLKTSDQAAEPGPGPEAEEDSATSVPEAGGGAGVSSSGPASTAGLVTGSSEGDAGDGLGAGAEEATGMSWARAGAGVAGAEDESGDGEAAIATDGADREDGGKTAEQKQLRQAQDRPKVGPGELLVPKCAVQHAAAEEGNPEQ